MAESSKHWQQLRKKGDRSWYAAYLRSHHWRRLRKLKLKSIRYTCEGCGYVDRYSDERRGYRLHLHHLTYARVGAEKLSDLRGLCVRCHKNEHANPLVNGVVAALKRLRRK